MIQLNTSYILFTIGIMGFIYAHITVTHYQHYIELCESNKIYTLYNLHDLIMNSTSIDEVDLLMVEYMDTTDIECINDDLTYLHIILVIFEILFIYICYDNKLCRK